MDGRTGEPVGSPVTVGYRYVLKLHHLVDVKIHGTNYPKVCGGCLAAPIWAQAVNGALAGTSIPDFSVPELSGDIPAPTNQNPPQGGANGGQDGGAGGVIGGFIGGQQ